MSIFDWLILAGTIGFIIAYGIWKTRGSRNIEDFLLADKTMKWWTICLSIMATQASAITFLSTPGQAYEDGMGFIQFYFGLPIAMVLISVSAVPVYARLNVYTAYEYLESRFDLKTRSLAAFLFLIHRGLAAGITIYAPSIILSILLGWNLTVTNILIGSLVVLYTVTGGTKAVSITQKQQMAVMMGGMILAGLVVIRKLPDGISFWESVQVAGRMGKMNLVNFKFDLNDRYNFWSGITGGLFLALSYFGTDQSQVARYLSGKSVTESRLGLLFNGLLKIPMQFIILFIGILVFVFYQFRMPPVFFNEQTLNMVKSSTYRDQVIGIEQAHAQLFNERKEHVNKMLEGMRQEEEATIQKSEQAIRQIDNKSKGLRKELKDLILKTDPSAETKDTDYVFLSFVMKNMPTGLIGLLLAVILCAAMSSTSSELNALASTTTVDIYKRSIYKHGTDHEYLNASRWITIAWGVIIIGFALMASLVENLIQLVNLLGSLFYGTILGIFISAFYIKYIRSNAVFTAAVITEVIVIVCYFTTKIAFLWYNVIGCALVILIAAFIQAVMPEKAAASDGEA